MLSCGRLAQVSAHGAPQSGCQVSGFGPDHDCPKTRLDSPLPMLTRTPTQNSGPRRSSEMILCAIIYMP